MEKELRRFMVLVIRILWWFISIVYYRGLCDAEDYHRFGEDCEGFLKDVRGE